MKILHTADWHMNDALGRVDRSEDIFGSIAQIAALCETHAVDVLIIAGDLFSERSRPAQTRAAIARLRELFSPFLARGGTILAVSGNHDSEVFFETLRDALELVSPTAKKVGENNDATGRLYLAPTPDVVTLQGKAGERVQFVLMPYPTSRVYLHNNDQKFDTLEAKHRAVQTAFKKMLDLLKKQLDPTLPAVLVSHIHIRGAQTHTLYKVTEVEDVIFEPGDIPTGWAYCAYGHIHQAQAPLQGAPHVRYCGSIVPLDMAEAKDEKGVVLLNVGAHGREGEIETLPLQVAPIHRVTLGKNGDAQSEVLQLAQQFPDRETALVSYELHWLPGRDNREELCRQINAIFPRWYHREWVQLDALDKRKSAQESFNLRDVTQTVRDYLAAQLDAKTPNRDAVVALAETFLAARDNSEKPAASTGTPPQTLDTPAIAPPPAAPINDDQSDEDMRFVPSPEDLAALTR